MSLPQQDIQQAVRYAAARQSSVRVLGSGTALGGHYTAGVLLSLAGMREVLVINKETCVVKVGWRLPSHVLVNTLLLEHHCYF